MRRCTISYGVANWFVRQAIDDQTLQVYGDGRIKRDFIDVDDCTNAMLRCTLSENCYGEVINVGDDQPSDFLELADTVIRVAGTGRWAFAPFSAERKAQEPGDFYPDITRIRQLVGWQPTPSLEDGMRRTVEFYRAHKRHYWE